MNLHTIWLFLSVLLLPDLAFAGSDEARSADPWPSFRGPGGVGRLAADLGDGPWTLETRWVRPLGSGYSGISIGGGMLITAARRGEHDVVLALDHEDGAEKWNYALESAYLGHDGSHDGPIATPAIADGRVFMVGAGGRVAAIRSDDGAELWTRHLTEDFSCESPRYGFAGSPAVADEVVVLQVGGDDGSFLGLDAASGDLLWRALPDSTYAGSPIVAEIGGETQILALSPSYVAGLDPHSGEILWQEEHDGSGAMGALSQSVLPLGDERLFVKHGEDGVMMIALDSIDDGKFAVSRTGESRGLTKSYSPPAFTDGVLYGYTGRFLSAVDSATGEMLWRSRPPGDGFLVVLDDQLAVLTKKGTLHLGEADRRGWTENDQITLFSDLAWTAPSAAGRSIYARSLGEIARVDLVRGDAGRAAPEVEPPPVLAILADEIAESAAAGEDAAEEIVDRFLAGRELPLIDDEDVVFLWRGEGDDVAVAGDMIGIRREEPMHRLANSDLWWWTTRIDRRARVNYLFFIGDQPAVDPSHRRRTTSSILGADLNWQRDEPLEMSWFAMPDWPGRNLPDRGRLESIWIDLPNTAETTETPVATRFRVWLPPGYDRSDARYPTVYVHHPDALGAGLWQETLDRVVGRTVAPVVVVFLESSPGDALAEVLVPAIDARFRTRAEASARAGVGIGFFAEAAIHATFQSPGVFGRLAVQSYFGIEQQMNELTELVGDLDADELPLRIYLEWGAYDIHSAHEAADVRISGRWLDAFLKKRGWEVYGGEMPDSTDFVSWNQRTDLLLQTLFPIDGEIPHDALRHWLGTHPQSTN